ncbi:MAG: ACP S-malonyltransferase [Clostridium sp.]|nr:ACP S-malonyltransferase [Clostridium sp.]
MNYALLFPGQGSQYIGMCSEQYQNNEDVRAIFDRASNVLEFDLWDMVSNGSLKVLTRSENAQPAIVAASYAMYVDFCKMNMKQPALAVGHSLGEISALICAGSISLEDGVRFVRKRGKLMDKVLENKIGFAGIVLDMEVEGLQVVLSKVNEKGYVAITGYNSAGQFMIGGVRELERVVDDEITDCGGQYVPHRMIPMKVNAPFHSLLMKEMQPELKELLDTMEFHAPQFPILSTVSGEIIDESTDIKSILLNQMIQPILWYQAIEKIQKKEFDAFIDVGPNKIMKNLVLENDKCKNVFAADVKEDRQEIENIMKQKGKV